MPSVGSSPRSQLLSTKLVAPQPPPGLVDRARLLDVLDRSMSGRVTLVSAGPGWGKTMLVASWVASIAGKRPVGWLSLDPFDNDPVLFWSYFGAAVGQAHDPIGRAPDAFGSLTIRPPVGQEVVRRIILALAQLDRPTVLVLDDFGDIHNAQVLDGLAEILRHPTQLRLVLITRSDPSLHLHRLRVDGELTEIRVADLAFTESESSALMKSSGVRVAPEVNRRLVSRTEGWATGLRLAAMFAARDDAGRIEEFTRAETAIAEYLVEEVLTNLSPDQRDFLLKTSVTDRLCAELADVLAQTTHAQTELEAMVRANAFTVAIGADHRWFRYHPLLADLLRHRLVLDHPDEVRELHRRAALWFIEHGEAVEAIRQAIRARDWPLVGELMMGGAAIRALSTERTAFGTLLAEIPPDALRATAELRATAAVLCLIEHDYPAFGVHVTHARELLGARAETDRRPIEAFLSVARLVLARAQGDVPGLITASSEVLDSLSDPAMAQTPAAAQYEAPALSNLGLGLIWAGRTDEAHRPLRQSLRLARDSGAELTAVNSLGYLAYLELEAGRLSKAHRTSTDALEIIDSRGWAEQCQAILAYLVLARIELEHDHLDTAQMFLDSAHAAQRNDPDLTPYPALCAAQARLWLAGGEAERARAAMSALRSEFAAGDLPAMLRSEVEVTDAEIDLACGRPGDCLDRLYPLLEDGADRDEVRVLIARAEEATDDHAAAESTLKVLRGRLANPLVAVQVGLLTALAAERRREDHRALAALDTTLPVAASEDIRRPFVQLGGRRLAALLRQWRALQPPQQRRTRQFAESLLDGLGRSGGDAIQVDPMAESLTDRERTVLTHMATLQTNEEIAADLFVSANTVKAHARGLYRKLGVANRREAVKRARDLGLL